MLIYRLYHLYQFADLILLNDHYTFRFQQHMDFQKVIHPREYVFHKRELIKSNSKYGSSCQNLFLAM